MNGPAPEPVVEPVVELVVVGAHLRGLPLHHELEAVGARFLGEAVTAPTYRLHALPTVPPKPGLVRVASGGAAVAVERYEVDEAGFGRFVAAVPPPLCIGSVELADGRWVKGFLCEPVGLDGAPDVTTHGGWRAYVAAGGAGGPG